MPRRGGRIDDGCEVYPHSSERRTVNEEDTVDGIFGRVPGSVDAQTLHACLPYLSWKTSAWRAFGGYRGNSEKLQEGSVVGQYNVEICFCVHGLTSYATLGLAGRNDGGLGVDLFWPASAAKRSTWTFFRPEPGQHLLRLLQRIFP